MSPVLTLPCLVEDLGSPLLGKTVSPSVKRPGDTWLLAVAVALPILVCRSGVNVVLWFGFRYHGWRCCIDEIGLGLMTFSLFFIWLAWFG